SMMDFHSTDRTTVYAPPRNAALAAIGFLPALQQGFNRRLKNAPEWINGHVSSGQSSKRWALNALKTPGLTLELADAASIAECRELGAAAADSLIGYFAP